MSIRRGRFITLEGGEGAGKTTHALHLEQGLRRRGVDVLRTREPGGTPHAEAIREVLLGQGSERMSPMTELLLMFAARSSHVTDCIEPALSKGRWVICDRFVDASHAYQGGGRGIAPDTLEQLERMVLEGFAPDHVLLFDLDPAVGLQRTQRRGAQNRFDHEEAGFQQRVRAAYLARARAHPHRYSILDAAQSIEALQAQLDALMDRWVHGPG